MTASARIGICVIGGGPAGSALAIRSAQLGHAVMLVERARFPRPHLGESLNPGIWPLLDLLGAEAAVAAAGFRTCRHALVQWEQPVEIRRQFAQPGLIVDRGRFDQLLLDVARSHGVRVLQPASILARRRDEAGWRLSVATAGCTLDLEASVLADASGRASALRGGRRAVGPRTIALYGYWRASAASADPMIAAGEDCWFWGVPLPDDSYNAIAFVDPALLRAGRDVTLTALYERLIAGSSLSAVGRHARLEGAVRAADATAYMAADAVGCDYIKVGEAALAIDPLSSSGVENAIQTGLQAAVVLNTLRRCPRLGDAAVSFYRRSLVEASQRHQRWASGFYKSIAEQRPSAFWEDRAIGASTREPPRAPSLAPSSRVALSEETRLVELPCILGDFIAVQSALAHPGIERPIAFLGGIEVAPLLRVVRSGTTLFDLVRKWSPSSLSPQRRRWLAF
jgi:flavin-dependent dehydrogenase